MPTPLLAAALAFALAPLPGGLAGGLSAGGGPLVLVLGGGAMLPLSLLWSQVAHSRRWTDHLERDAAALGLGACRVILRDASRCVVAVVSCRTCAEEGRGPCERERRVLKLALQPYAPKARVDEILCATRGQGRLGACTFEVKRGREP